LSLVQPPVSRADPAARFARLQKLAREYVAAGKPQDIERPELPRGSLEAKVYRPRYVTLGGNIFLPPVVVVDKNVLWYDLGSYSLGSDAFFSVDGEAGLPVYSRYEFNETLAADAERQAGDGNWETTVNPASFPLRSLLLVELIRRFRSENEEQRSGWRKPLAEVEGLVQLELRVLDTALRETRRDENDGRGSAVGIGSEDRYFDRLCDLDERILRIVISHIDRTAADRSLEVRRIRFGIEAAGGAGEFTVQFNVMPVPTAFRRLSALEYQWLEIDVGAGNVEKFLNRWELIGAHTLPPGQNYVIAVFGTPDVGQSYATAVRYPFAPTQNGVALAFTPPRPLNPSEPPSLLPQPGTVSAAPAPAPVAPVAPPPLRGD
jgi:hypothetical protein